MRRPLEKKFPHLFDITHYYRPVLLFSKSGGHIRGGVSQDLESGIKGVKKSGIRKQRGQKIRNQESCGFSKKSGSKLKEFNIL